MKFFNGPYDFLYGPKLVPGSPSLDDGVLPAPGLRVEINKVAELVQLFGPALYHRNPIRKVSPRQSPALPPDLWNLLAPTLPPRGGRDPLLAMQAQMQMQAHVQRVQAMQQQAQQRTSLDQARALLLESYLNATPPALDLKSESRNAIDEALIKGLGVLVSEPYEPPGSGRRMVGSFYQAVDDLVIDPDMRSLRDAKWIAIRCRHPHWEVEEEYGLPRDSLKGVATQASAGKQAETDAAGADGQFAQRRGQTNDLVTYWKIWSKMGLGGRLAGVTSSVRDISDTFGPYCYLVVADGLPYPLNVPPGIVDRIEDVDSDAALTMERSAQERVAWPTPYWADDSWPITPIAFHWVPGEVWPMSHLKPAMGELKAINWIWSMLVSKVKTASRDFIAILKSTSDEVKNKILHGADYTMIEVEAIHDSIDKMVKFLQHPEFNPEIYKVLQGLTELFDRRTGLTELLYGLSASQLRSAEEASLKGDQVSVRPDDMANKVEEAMSALAAREAFCARWHLTGADVVPQLGEEAAFWWDQLLSGADPDLILQLQYRIEAGSTRKPNRARDQANMAQAMQTLFVPLFEYGQATGDLVPVNNLMAQWGKSLDLDAGAFLLQPPPPPPPAPALLPAPSGNGAARNGKMATAAA